MTRYPLETLPLASMTNRYHPLPESPPVLHLAVIDVPDLAEKRRNADFIASLR